MANRLWDVMHKTYDDLYLFVRRVCNGEGTNAEIAMLQQVVQSLREQQQFLIREDAFKVETETFADVTGKTFIRVFLDGKEIQKGVG